VKVRYRERALADLEEISAYISERNPIGAINVLAAIHAAVAEAALNPLASRQTSDPQVRVKIVRRYLYKIFLYCHRRRDRDIARPARCAATMDHGMT
jgi:plasmid stabilization system protein ParE